MEQAEIVGKYDEIIRQPRMRALYGNSGYFNVGYWDRGIASLPQACDRMVDELAAAIPPDARLIADIGCGLGAGTRRLAGLFPRALVLGCNISHWQLLQARARGVEASAVMDAARLALASGSADAVVALESAQHFDTRAKFLHEARRVLRTGGTVALADILFRDRDSVGAWMLPPANQVAGPEAYADLLEAAGFADLRVIDVTRLTWGRFCDEMRPLFAGHEDRLEILRESVSHYLLAFGRAA
jgi:MPBQ/MSBQ methyltransferase